MSIKIKELTKGHLPIQKTKGSAGYDCKCVTDLSRLKAFNVSYPDAHEARTPLFLDSYSVKGSDTKITLYPQWRLLIPLGFALEFPPHLVAKLYLRSSLGLKSPLFIPNSVGIIDSDYRGEVGLILGTQFPTTLDLSKTLCQITFEHRYISDIEKVSSLQDTDRGQGGFGSTGA
jgi:dUTP pyrophosphatase